MRKWQKQPRVALTSGNCFLSFSITEETQCHKESCGTAVAKTKIERKRNDHTIPVAVVL